MRSDIFRKVSLERLSSPEQLDQLMRVTSTKGWLALITLFGLLTLVVVWGFTGRVPTRVQASGVLMKSGGVYDVVPLASGQVTDISVRPGDQVREGQVLARINQPDLAEEVKKAGLRLQELQARHEQLERYWDRDARLQADLAAQQTANLDGSIASTEEQIAWLRERMENQQELYDGGLITKQTLLATKEQLHATRERAEQLRNELKQVSLQLLTQQNQRHQDLLSSELQINELEREIQQMEDQMVTATEVTSPYTGRILEIMSEVGSLASQGQPLMRLDRVGSDVNDLEAVLYVPGADGKKVKAGMDVQISPTTVRREEYGFIEAEVTRISDFPATPEGMTRVLKNNQLLQMLAGSGAPYETYAVLKLDPSTPTGYQWSSSRGPDGSIQSGTLCTATITVRSQRPAEMVMPALRKFFGV